MARVSIPIQTAAAFGGKLEDLSYTSDDGAGELSFVHPGGTVIVFIKNGSGAPVAATFDSVASRRTFNRVGDIVVTTTNGEESAVAIPDVGFNQGSGVVNIDLATEPLMDFAVVKATPTS